MKEFYFCNLPGFGRNIENLLEFHKFHNNILVIESLLHTKNTKVQTYAEVIQPKQRYITENLKDIIDKCHQFGITDFY